MVYKDAASLLLSLLTVLLAACMPLNPEENGIGRYTATVTGGLDTTLAGPAVHYAGNQVEGFKYVIHLRTAGAVPLGIFLWTAERPRVGVYQIGRKAPRDLEANEAKASLQVTNGEPFISRSGEIRISSATPLQGTFRFQATTPITGLTDAIVSGSFAFD